MMNTMESIEMIDDAQKELLDDVYLNKLRVNFTLMSKEFELLRSNVGASNRSRQIC